MFAEDMSPFFNTAEFASDATLAGLPVRGIFDSSYVAEGGGMGMSSTVPVFMLPTASIPANPVGLLLVVGGVTYAVAVPEPDGTGVTVLILERAA